MTKKKKKVKRKGSLGVWGYILEVTATEFVFCF